MSLSMIKHYSKVQEAVHRKQRCATLPWKRLCFLMSLLSILTLLMYVYVSVSSFHTQKIAPLNLCWNGMNRQIHNDCFLPQYTHNNTFKYLLLEEAICSNDSNHFTELIILVETAPNNFNERQTIRETWGSYSRRLPEVKLVFILGQTESSDINRKIQNESASHRDIIQNDFHDSYKNLTLKSISVLKWVNGYCKSAKYLLKSDDDMFINIPVLLTALRNVKHKRFIIGQIIHGARPVQDIKSKWYTPKSDFPSNIYPDYASGTAYAMSVDLIPDLIDAAISSTLFWLEDIFITGVCGKKVGAKLIHDGRFTYDKRAVSACAYRMAITGHRNTPSEIKQIWKGFQQNKTC